MTSNINPVQALNNIYAATRSLNVSADIHDQIKGNYMQVLSALATAAPAADDAKAPDTKPA